MQIARTQKASSTLRSSRAVPHPSTNRALRRLTSEFGRDPVHSTRYGRWRPLYHVVLPCHMIVGGDQMAPFTWSQLASDVFECVLHALMDYQNVSSSSLPLTLTRNWLDVETLRSIT